MVNDPPWDLITIIRASRDGPMGKGGMKFIKLWSRDGTLKVEIVLINDVGIDRDVAALWGEGDSL